MWQIKKISFSVMNAVNFLVFQNSNASYTRIVNFLHNCIIMCSTKLGCLIEYHDVKHSG